MDPLKSKIFLSDHDILRKHIYKVTGLDRDKFDLEALRASEWSPEFERLQRNRLIIGALRYGLLGDLEKPNWDRVSRAKELWCDYEKTGNLECLVDAANMAMLEYVEGRHPNRHFNAVDDGDHTKIKD